MIDPLDLLDGREGKVSPVPDDILALLGRAPENRPIPRGFEAVHLEICSSTAGASGDREVLPSCSGGSVR